MRKTLSIFIAFSFLMVTIVPPVANAQTSLQDNVKKIQELTAQIQALQEQIKMLQQQQAQLQVSTNQAIVEIVQGLREGSEGDQVTLLQTLLALDASIYPEGKISGFFGPLTRRALQRYQSRLGLEAVGFVGPRTREALNRIIREQFKAIKDLENDVDDDVKDAIEDAFGSIVLPPRPTDPCAIPNIPFSSSTPFIQKDGKFKIVQTGNVFIYQDGKRKIIITPNTYHEKDGKKELLITPGMHIEKDGKSKLLIPCNGTTTPPTPALGSDSTAPVISSIHADASRQSATITWKTDEGATGKVYYGSTSPLNLGSASSTMETQWWWFNNLNTNHSVQLIGLSASTTYYFVIESKDKKGNVATSTEQSFTTNMIADTTAPTVTAISVSGIGTSTATIGWTTNENAGSKIYYGTSTPLNTGSALIKIDSTLLTNHSLTLSALAPNTTHYFKVESADAAGNTTLSSEAAFTTSALPLADSIVLRRSSQP